MLSRYLPLETVHDLRRRERVKGSKFPELYLILRQHRLNVDLLAAGVEFITMRAVSEPKNAALSRLSGLANGTMLEAAVLGSLIQTFGSESVEPYPKVPGGRRLEARVSSHATVFYVEATALLFSEKDRRGMDEARKKGRCHFRTWHPDLGADRLIRKIDEKIDQLAKDVPNVLIVSNMAMMPASDEALRALTRILADPARRKSQLHLSAIVYMDGYIFSSLLLNDCPKPLSRISDETANSLETAIRAISTQTRGRT